MPVYDYQCQTCGKEEEIIKPIAERDNVSCPACCARMTRKEVYPYHWYMGWKFLKNVKSEPAPNDAGYHKKWDD